MQKLDELHRNGGHLYRAGTVLRDLGVSRDEVEQD